MSYEHKKGHIISRRDFEKITDKEFRKEFQPSGKIPTHALEDDNEFDEIPESERKAENVKATPPAPPED